MDESVKERGSMIFILDKDTKKIVWKCVHNDLINDLDIDITHSHQDHCSIEDLEKIIKPGTVIVVPACCQSGVEPH